MAQKPNDNEIAEPMQDESDGAQQISTDEDEGVWRQQICNAYWFTYITLLDTEMKSVPHTPEHAPEDEPAVAPVIAPSNEHNPAIENKQADNDDDKHEDTFPNNPLIQSDEDQQYLTPEEWPGGSPACSTTVVITTPESDIETTSPYSSPQNASLNGVVQSNAVESGVVQLNRVAIRTASQRHLYHQWPDPPYHDDSCSCHGPTDIEDSDDQKEEDVDTIEGNDDGTTGNDDDEKEEIHQYDEKEE